jgi:hypothetical protein
MTHALAAGAAQGTPAVVTYVQDALKKIEKSVAQIELKKVPSGAAATAEALANMHKTAGIELSPMGAASIGPSSTAPVLMPRAAVPPSARPGLPRPF